MMLTFVLSLMFMMMTFKDALKGREPVIYVRVSTKEQKGTLPKQIATIEAWLKANKITRKPKVFKEQTSGTNPNPPELLKAIEYCISKPGKTFLIVRDFQRISRNWRYGGKNLIPLFENDVPVVSALKNQMSSTTTSIQDEDWLIGLFMALGAQEVDQVKKRTEAGVAAAAEKGVLRGTNKDFFPKEALNPYRELKRLLEAGVGQTEASRRLGRSTSWFRKNRDFFRLITERGGDSLLETWLDLSDKIRRIENEQRGGKTKEEAKKLKAVRRMTSGFVQEPFNFPIPTDEMLEEYLTNFKEYQPKRTK